MSLQVRPIVVACGAIELPRPMTAPLTGDEIYN